MKEPQAANSEQQVKLEQSKKRKHEDKENEVYEKKANLEEEATEDDDEASTKKSKFDWTDCVSQILDQKGSIKWSKLKKKVVNEYLTLHPNTVKTRAELETKLEKKVRKNKKFKTSNEIVTFATSRDEK